jgi:hypothetical protein
VSLFEDRDEVEMLQMLQKLLGFEVFQVWLQKKVTSTISIEIQKGA